MVTFGHIMRIHMHIYIYRYFIFRCTYFNYQNHLNFEHLWYGLGLGLGLRLELGLGTTGPSGQLDPSHIPSIRS